MARLTPAALCLALVACSAKPDGLAPGPGASIPEVWSGPGLRVDATAPPPRPLEGFLPFFYDLYTFRGDGERTRVVAAFAVEAGRLKEERERDRRLYHFDVTLVLADTAVGAVIRSDDSVFVAAPRPLASGHLLYTQVEAEAPASITTVQRAIMTDAARAGVGQLYDSAFPIPDYRGDDLMLSDIALSQPDVEGGWRRGDVALALLPTSQLPVGAFDVYYEIYNLPAGHPYRTEIAVQEIAAARAPEEDGAGAVTRLRFTGESRADAGGTLQELRRVDTSLPRGTYRLTVTITDLETGRSAERSRTFSVRGWGPGATLVPALPRRHDADG